MGFLKKIIKTSNERELIRLRKIVAAINAFEPKIQALSDTELTGKTAEFRARIKENEAAFSGELEALQENYEEASSEEDKQKLKQKIKFCRNSILDPLLPEAFAVVRETAHRTIGQRPFDVQLIGGIVLHEGKISEMATGEGKTLAATMPLYLNTLLAGGCHLVTVNDYLARRDREWMGPIYEFLGLSVGVIQHDIEPEVRQQAYACDITYGTNNEFGFDYLRDNMVPRKESRAQSKLCYAIVDEVDSILIDESRTPLIISGPAEESPDAYFHADKLVRRLKVKFVTEAERIDAKSEGRDLEEELGKAGYDYLVDEKHHTVVLTKEGEDKAQKRLNLPDLFDGAPAHLEMVHHINQALRAHSLFKRDVEYMLKDGQVMIVDEFTGRLMPGRRWSDGLHQAVEAKEGVKIERENQTLATITFQNYFRLYGKLAGMTGTALTEANEFHKIYNLKVIAIPTNCPLIRNEKPDIVYQTWEEKLEAVVEEISVLHQKGQPVLVGTISIAKSETLSRMLKKRNIPHHVLNARYHEQEAEIIAQAGRWEAVTIATNMAGRGTDIILGGNPKFLARTRIEEQGLDPDKVSAEASEEFLSRAELEVAQKHEQVIQAGGLHIIGTERHESRRIDNQLRGRAGRQGDPGASQFFLSLEDDLMRIFASEKIANLMEKFNLERGQPLTLGEGALTKFLSRTIEGAQKQVEAHNFSIRKQLLEYDNIMNRQRQVIYEDRRAILEGGDFKEDIFKMTVELVEEVVGEYAARDAHAEEWDVKGLEERINHLFPFSFSGKDFSEADQLQEFIIQKAEEAYQSREQEVGKEAIQEFTRHIFLHFTDSKWKDHLYAMDHLREGIHYRSWGEKDPLIEYQHEAYAMFEDLKGRIVEDTVRAIFHLRPVAEEMKEVFSLGSQQLLHPEAGTLPGKGFPAGAKPQKKSAGRARNSFPPGAVPQNIKSIPFKREEEKVGRNAPCPCGSGKKYKKCCGK